MYLLQSNQEITSPLLPIHLKFKTRKNSFAAPKEFSPNQYYFGCILQHLPITHSNITPAPTYKNQKPVPFHYTIAPRTIQIQFHRLTLDQRIPKVLSPKMNNVVEKTENKVVVMMMLEANSPSPSIVIAKIKDTVEVGTPNRT